MVNSDINMHTYCIEKITGGRKPMQYIAYSKTLEKINEINLASAVSVRKKMWAPSRMFRISYLDGGPIEHKRAKEIANEWMDYAKRN